MAFAAPQGLGPRPLDVRSADKALRRAVLMRLVSDPLVSSGHIGVEAVAGAVTLSGYVTSHAQKDAASAAARHVDGVEQIVDIVLIAVPRSSLTESPPDGADAPANIRSRLAFSASMSRRSGATAGS